MRVQMVYMSWFTLDLPWKACLCVSSVTAVVSVDGSNCSITFDAHLSSQILLSGAATQLRIATVSFMLTAWNILAPTGRIFMKFGI
jgi:hypothetical protein